MRARIVGTGYRVAWRILSLLAPLHRGRGRGVKAVLSHEGRVLLVRHTYGPERWELPGGGLRRGEAPLDGVRREIREELGVEITGVRQIAYGCGSPRHTHRTVTVFTAELPAAEVTLHAGEIARAEWFGPDRLPARLGWQVTAAVGIWARGDEAEPVELRPG
jgi:ADP-ribose pyrophosphatase YjhB (NUDIX family)